MKMYNSKQHRAILRKQLQILDYQTIKTMEVIIRKWVETNGTNDLPYKDIIDRFNVRDVLRDQINALEIGGLNNAENE